MVIYGTPIGRAFQPPQNVVNLPLLFLLIVSQDQFQLSLVFTTFF
jgi:hypothetical protein